VQRDYHCLEEDHMLFTQRHCEAGNDRGQDIEQLCGTVKFVVLMD
jgi:hypothetical protein